MEHSQWDGDNLSGREGRSADQVHRKRSHSSTHRSVCGAVATLPSWQSGRPSCHVEALRPVPEEDVGTQTGAEEEAVLSEKLREKESV